MPFMDDAGYPWRSRSLNDEYQLLSDGYGAENTTRQNIVGGILARSIALSLGLVLFSARRPLGRFASNVAHNTYIALQRLALRPGALRIRDLDAPLSPATGANHAPSKWFPRTLRRLFSKSHTAELAHGIDCSCYYTDNMFVNSPVRAHFSFVSDAQFESLYPDLLSSLTHQQRGELYDQLHAEAARRKGAAQAAEARKRLIAREYKPRWPSLWTLSIEHLNPDFVDMVKGGTVPEKLGQGDVYSIPVFSARFCEMLCEELDHFDASGLPMGRPNSMNNHGVLLDELGMTEGLILPLMHEWIKPLCARFNLFVTESEGLDHVKAFVVRYKIGEDEQLASHFDNAEVTLNINIGRRFEGGELAFFGLRSEPRPPPPFYHDWEDEGVGYAVLHRGQELHCALPISDGERLNLVIWMRSAAWRQSCGCPMCGSTARFLT